MLARNARGELEGRLAERWEHSADYHEWTYYLRPGIRWHDGLPVTAHDVAFSLEWFTHPNVGIAGPDWFEAAFSFLSNGALRSQFGPPFPTGYRNNELVALIDRVESTADPAVEAQAIRRIAEIFRADVPATFLIPGNRAIVAHTRLHGLSSPWRADPLSSMEDLWIEE